MYYSNVFLSVWCLTVRFLRWCSHRHESELPFGFAHTMTRDVEIIEIQVIQPFEDDRYPCVSKHTYRVKF